MTENESNGLRRVPVYIRAEDSRYDALLDLQVHLMEYNARFGTAWSLVAPKRGRIAGPVVGKAKDGNHLMYQFFVDRILAECPRPLTVDSIRQKLVDLGEKPSTSKMIAGDYLGLISKVIDPSTKRHRGANKTLAEWGSL